MRKNNLIGHTFGHLTVIGEAPRASYGTARWLCQCQCGGRAIVFGNTLTCGLTQSCGCRKGNLRHGHARKGRISPERQVWSSMWQRCTNPKQKGWEYYGGRGIRVCKRWMSFENFLADMGARPVGTTIDRIDPDGNYEPGNCRWADRATQANNQRRNRLTAQQLNR